MGFNFSVAYDKFEQQQKKNRELYLSLGMPEEAVETILAFDKAQFKSDYKFYRRMQSLTGNDEVEEGMNPLIKRFANVLVVYQQPSKSSRYWWIDEIEDEELYKKVKKLTLEELDIITKLVFEGYKRKEIYAELNISKAAFSKRIKRIKMKILEEK